MNLGFLTELFGHHGIRTIWKVLLIWSALAIFGRFQTIENWLNFELGASWLSIRNITAVLLVILFWMIHKNQM